MSAEYEVILNWANAEKSAVEAAKKTAKAFDAEFKRNKPAASAFSSKEQNAAVREFKKAINESKNAVKQLDAAEAQILANIKRTESARDKAQTDAVMQLKKRGDAAKAANEAEQRADEAFFADIQKRHKDEMASAQKKLDSITKSERAALDQRRAAQEQAQTGAITQLKTASDAAAKAKAEEQKAEDAFFAHVKKTNQDYFSERQKTLDDITKSEKKALSARQKDADSTATSLIQKEEKLKDAASQTQNSLLKNTKLTEEQKREIYQQTQQELEKFQGNLTDMSAKELQREIGVIKANQAERVSLAVEANAKKKKDSDDSTNTIRNNEQKLAAFRKTLEADLLRAYELTEQQRADITADTENKIQAIEGRASTLSRAELQAELDAVRAASAEKIRVAREAAQIQAVEASKAGKVMNRRMQIAFNAQQVIEDFNAAGFKGISNNIAFMAMSLGGLAGIITVTAVGVGNLLSVLVDWKAVAKSVGLNLDAEKERLEANKKALEEYTKKLKETLDLRGKIQEFDRASRATVEGVSDTNTRRDNVDFLEARKRLQEQILGGIKEEDKRIKTVLQANKELLITLKRKESIARGGPDRAGRDMAEVSRLTRLMVQVRSNINALEASTGKSSEEVKAAKEALDGLQKELNVEKSLLSIEQERLDIFKQIADRRKQTEDISFRKRGPTSPGDVASSREAGIRNRFDERRNKILEETDRFIARQQDKIANIRQEMLALNLTAEEEKQKKQEILDLYEAQAKAEEDAAKRIEGSAVSAGRALDRNHEWLKSMQQVEDSASNVRSTLESQIDATRQLIIQEKERAQALRESARASRESFTLSRFGAKGQAISAVSAGRIEAINQRREALKRQAPGASAAIDAQADAAIRAIENQEKASLAQNKQAQFQFLKDSAQQYTAEARKALEAGETAVAEKLFDKARGFLEQAQQEVFGAVDANARKNESRFEEAERLQRQIEDLFRQEAEAAQAAENVERGRLESMQQELLTVQGIQDQMKDAQFVSEVNVQAAARIADQLGRAAAFAAQIQRAQDTSASPLGQNLPGFAAGGPMPSGGPYLVGEEGPEIIFPNRAGFVANAKDSANILGQSFLPHRGTAAQGRGPTSVSTSNFGGVHVNHISGLTLAQMEKEAARRARFQKTRRS